MGIPNPYRLRPFVGARVPVNSSFSPLISIFNPHSEPLQVRKTAQCSVVLLNHLLFYQRVILIILKSKPNFFMVSGCRDVHQWRRPTFRAAYWTTGWHQKIMGEHNILFTLHCAHYCKTLVWCNLSSCAEFS